MVTENSNTTLSDANGTTPPQWRHKALAHRSTQLSKIPPEWRLAKIPSASDARSALPIIESCGILTAEELEMTSPTVTAPQILDKLHSRSWTSVAVTTAFCKRAAILQQLTGCLTEIMFETAIERARELDRILESTGKPVGALHGLPISLKDNHEIEGIDTTVGWVGLIGKPAKRDVPAVETYRRLGAVLYVKTNIPQSLMMSDSYNYLWGQSVNSLHRELISGGSSGGEGALVGAAGSVIGVGTDIGGSVRIPAALQGLYGLSPTIGRVPNRESVRSQKYIVRPVAGPLTRDLGSMEVYMKSYLGTNPWETDPGIFPIPWRENEVSRAAESKKLKIGYVVDDGVILPQPPVQRAVRQTCEKLKKAGHEVFEWDATSHQRGYDLWLRAVLADGGDKCKALCELMGEPLIEGMLVGREENRLDTAQKMELHDEIWDFQRDYMKRWNESGIDALIMPVTQWVGLRPKAWVKSDMYVGYTSIWNLMDWTALTIPAINVSKDLDQPDQNWKNHQSRSFSDQFNHDYYDLDLFDGMPVGVQIVTGRFGEEKAIGIAKVMDALRG